MLGTERVIYINSQVPNISEIRALAEWLQYIEDAVFLAELSRFHPTVFEV